MSAILWDTVTYSVASHSPGNSLSAFWETLSKAEVQQLYCGFHYYAKIKTHKTTEDQGNKQN